MQRINGIQVLRMCQHREFKDGDMLIAFQEDTCGEEYVSIYKFSEHENSSFSFTDVEHDCELDVFDLSECEFMVVKPKRAKNNNVVFDEYCEKLQEVARRYGSYMYNWE